MTGTVLTERRGHVLLIGLNRPDKLNAFTPEMLRDLGVSHADMMKRDGFVLVVRRCEIDYLKSARLDDLLSVETEIAKLGGASGDLRQRVLRDNDVLAELKVLVVCIDRDGRPHRIPDYVRGALPRMTQSE